MTSQDDSWQTVLSKEKHDILIFNEIQKYVDDLYKNLTNGFGDTLSRYIDKRKTPNAAFFCQKVKHTECLETKNKIIVKNNISFSGGFRCLEFFAYNAKRVSVSLYPSNTNSDKNSVNISSLYNIKTRLNENGEVVKNTEGQIMYYVEANEYIPEFALFYSNIFKQIIFEIESETLGDVYLTYMRGKKRDVDNSNRNLKKILLLNNDTQYNFQMKDYDINIRSIGLYFNEMRFKFELEDENAGVDFDSFEIFSKAHDEYMCRRTIVHRHELVFLNKNEFIYKDFLFYLFSNDHMVIRFNKLIDAKVTLTIKNYDSIVTDKEYNYYKYCETVNRKCEVYSNVATM